MQIASINIPIGHIELFRYRCTLPKIVVCGWVFIDEKMTYLNEKYSAHLL